MRQKISEPGSANRSSDTAAQKEARRFVLDAEQTCIPMIFTDATLPENTVLFANTSYLDLAGYAPAEIVGRPIRDLLRPPVRNNPGLSILSAIEEGAEGSWDLCCRRADDREFFATVFNCPIHDQAGGLVQNALSLVKIDGHVNRLVQSHTEFYAIFQQAPGFIAITEGPRHRFTFANISYMNFVGQTDVEGLNVADVFPELISQGFIDLLDNVFTSGEPYIAKDVELSFKNLSTGNLEQKFADFVYQPVRAVDGTITGIFCEGYDVTVQHFAADRLATLQAEMIHVSRANAMGTMAVTLAHELNQPLAAIVNYAEGAERFVRAAGPQSSMLAEALLEISGAAHRASELLRNLRELTAGRGPDASQFGLRAACAECIRLVSIVAEPAVTIVSEIPPDIVINCDRIQIQQVLINILRNACEALRDSEHRHIAVSAFEENCQIVVSVTDTGPGVSRDAAQQMFNFAESSKKEGMGIGLSICRTILENHGGRIWLNRSDETGTEMRFSLPLSDSKATATQ